METKRYFEKIMQDYNQNCKWRNLRKYCSDKGVLRGSLTHIMNVDEDNLAMLPCYYAPTCKEEQECALSVI